MILKPITTVGNNYLKIIFANRLFSISLFSCIFVIPAYASDLPSFEDAYEFLRNDDMFESISDGYKTTCANVCIRAGVLRPNNGDCHNFSLHQKFVNRCLKYGSTATASPRMFSEGNCTQRSDGFLTLNLEDMGLETVRDWKYQKFLDRVAEINLSYNPLHDGLPKEFFEFFPKLKKINLKHTKIQELWLTKNMPAGLIVVAADSSLNNFYYDRRDVNRLKTERFIFNFINTPLAQNTQEIARLRRLCSTESRSLCTYFCCYWLAFHRTG